MSDTARVRARLTMFLIAVNVGVFLLMLKVGESGFKEFSSHTLAVFGANYGPLVVRDHQLYRLVTSMFIHLDPLHLLLNMAALFSVGRYLERPYGPRRYLALYLASGVAGSIASVALHWKDPVVSAGASGAICGLIAAAAVMGHRLGPAGLPMRNAMLRWAAMTLGYGAMIHADNAAHCGGLAAGALFGLAYGVPAPRKEDGIVFEAIALIGVVGASFGLVARLGDRADTPASLVNRGVEAAKAGHDDQAILLYRRALELDPNDAIANHDLGLALQRTSGWEEAEAAFQRAHDIEPTTASTAALVAAHVSHGVALAQEKRDDDAILQYRSALELAPKDAIATYDLALALHRKGDLDGAIAALDGAIANGGGPDARNMLERILVSRGVDAARAGKLDDAIGWYGRALEVAPNSATANFDLAIALHKRGDYEPALRAIEASLATEPTKPAQRELGWILLRLGRKEESAEALQRAASMPDDPPDGADGK